MCWYVNPIDGTANFVRGIPLAAVSVGPRQVRFVGELLARSQLRRIYSTALALAWVAAGRADAACNLGVRAWDVAAGAALVAAAGGRYVPVGHPDVLRAGGFVATAAGAAPIGGWLVEQVSGLADG